MLQQYYQYSQFLSTLNKKFYRCRCHMGPLLFTYYLVIILYTKLPKKMSLRIVLRLFFSIRSSFPATSYFVHSLPNHLKYVYQSEEQIKIQFAGIMD